ISGAQAASNPTDVDFSSQAAGGCYTQAITIQNAGSTTLSATVAVTGAPYHVGRGSLSVGPGLSDTVGVTFCPTSAGTFPDTLVVTSNACGAGPLRIPITGTATSSAVVNLTLPLGGESWEWNTEHELTWTSTNVTNVALDYRVAPGAGWNAIVASVPASQEVFTWTVPNAPADSAQVRVRDVGGTTEDLSGFFQILVPMFGATPDPLDLGSTDPGTPVGSVLTFENKGGADLTITGISIGSPEFWVGRTSLVIPAAGQDTVGVYYDPFAPGPDTTLMTITALDPLSPHNVVLIGAGNGTVAVDGPPPTAFAAWQNLPNPFKGSTRIRYALPVSAPVSLEVYNLLGQRVATLVRETQEAGLYSVNFGAGASGASGERIGTLPAGVYFYQLRAGSFTATRKMLLLH
ncbi:MAG TPA: choice-of-anchor D domain-containing protein, partial [Candidatus Limnocylindria bacterium]|nr:choice-of-anchor D domain-containing protein [Candidatus Limnocylindria bacterium]